jgi:hypothetical protein
MCDARAADMEFYIFRGFSMVAPTGAKAPFNKKARFARRALTASRGRGWPAGRSLYGRPALRLRMIR